MTLDMILAVYYGLKTTTNDLFASLDHNALPKGCSFNPLCTGELFHCFMLDKSICHFRGIRSIMTL